VPAPPLFPTATSTPSASPTAAPSPSPIPSPVSRLGIDAQVLHGLTIRAWHPWFGNEAALFESQVAEFNATNPWGFQVVAVGQVNFAELFTNVTLALGSPDRPDLVISLSEHALAWDKAGVVDLTPYLTDPLWGLSADETADFYPVLWDQDQIGGRRLGLPAQRTARLLFYNQSWARQLGFDSPPQTPDQFRRQACRANASFRQNADPQDDALGGWLIDPHPMTALGWMLAFGGGPLKGDAYHFLSPENLDAFRFIKTLFDDGCAFLAPDANPADEFAARRALFLAGDLEDIPSLSRAFLERGNPDRWIVLPFPGRQPTLVTYGSSYIILAKQPAEQLAAWLFLRWMLTPEQQARWVSAMGFLPVRRSALPLLDDYRIAYPQWAQAVEALPAAQGTPRLASWRLMRQALGDGFAYLFRMNLPPGQIPTLLAEMDKLATEFEE